MRIRNSLMLLIIALFTGAHAEAQRTPPVPSTPPSAGLTVPLPPDAPLAFSFSTEGGYLGISPENIDKENMSQYGLSAPRGVGIGSVSQGSPAERAGLKKGDVILQFDGEPVTGSRKLLRLIGEAAPEQTVRLTISRNNSEQQISVTLGQREDGLRSYRTLVTPRGERGDLLRLPRVPQVWNEAPGFYAYGLGNNRRVGVTTTPLTKQLADFFGVSGGQGLLITSISENSPAAKAGLRAGDVITEMNGEKLDSADDFVRVLNRKEDGEVTLTIIRDKSQRTMKVMPERRPAPTLNLSELLPAEGIGRIIPPVYRMDMPELRTLQTVPGFVTPVLPKIEGTITVPPMMKTPRIEQLLPAPGIL